MDGITYRVAAIEAVRLDSPAQHKSKALYRCLDCHLLESLRRNRVDVNGRTIAEEMSIESGFQEV